MLTKSSMTMATDSQRVKHFGLGCSLILLSAVTVSLVAGFLFWLVYRQHSWWTWCAVLIAATLISVLARRVYLRGLRRFKADRQSERGSP
jgi:uncharacterized membrane protein YdjX (TVP38/TMEM64 family)